MKAGIGMWVAGLFAFFYAPWRPDLGIRPLAVKLAIGGFVLYLSGYYWRWHRKNTAKGGN
ncbi:MAG: hypothetical protein GF333_00075 [Candidatus Omnitrophica bacterium]|nr:hypothetical protein [Candidatus Omnitrophota bacterium]